MTEHPPTPSTSSTRSMVLPWLKLMRLPTVFTALANVMCGFFVSHSSLSLDAMVVHPAFWLLLCASAGLYLGGMVLNDVFDASLDAKERPDRPIPAGQISRGAAASFGAVLITLGLTSAATADRFSNVGFPAAQIAIALAACVVLYDSLLKNTSLAPFGMGSCRFLNIMLGASCAGPTELVWTSPQLLIAAALGVYVFGVTWFARNEAGDSSTSSLYAAMVVVMLGVAGYLWIAFQCYQLQPTEKLRTPAIGAVIAIGLIGANVFTRALQAVRSGNQKLLPRTVGFMLLNIIFLDAAITFCVTGNAQHAAAIVILVIPASLLKRVIPMS